MFVDSLATIHTSTTIIIIIIMIIIIIIIMMMMMMMMMMINNKCNSLCPGLAVFAFHYFMVYGSFPSKMRLSNERIFRQFAGFFMLGGGYGRFRLSRLSGKRSGTGPLD